MRMFKSPIALLFALTPLAGGCTAQQDAAPAKPDAAATESDTTTSPQENPFAELSDEDQKLAAAQAICPVSGEPLGSMGTPIKVTKGDRALFLCCKGCEEDALKRFDELYDQLHSEQAE